MKIGSNQFKTKQFNWLGVSKKAYNSILWLTLLTIVMGWSFWYYLKPAPLISPVIDQYPSGVCVSCMKPTNTPQTQKQQILSYIVKRFGDDAPDAIVLLRKCENSTFGMDKIGRAHV